MQATVAAAFALVEVVFAAFYSVWLAALVVFAVWGTWSALDDRRRRRNRPTFAEYLRARGLR